MLLRTYQEKVAVELDREDLSFTFPSLPSFGPGERWPSGSRHTISFSTCAGDAIPGHLRVSYSLPTKGGFSSSSPCPGLVWFRVRSASSLSTCWRHGGRRSSDSSPFSAPALSSPLRDFFLKFPGLRYNIFCLLCRPKATFGTRSSELFGLIVGMGLVFISLYWLGISYVELEAKCTPFHAIRWRLDLAMRSCQWSLAHFESAHLLNLSVLACCTASG